MILNGFILNSNGSKLRALELLSVLLEVLSKLFLSAAQDPSTSAYVWIRGPGALDFFANATDCVPAFCALRNMGPTLHVVSPGSTANQSWGHLAL